MSWDDEIPRASNPDLIILFSLSLFFFFSSFYCWLSFLLPFELLKLLARVRLTVSCELLKVGYQTQFVFELFSCSLFAGFLFFDLT
ncbi:hypothetical protein BDV97DRAFT_347704 [Delphinella strobiligena]|nr:hypothetical protein BDV97DRAFT_347704 [Delphinella strobiligena]